MDESKELTNSMQPATSEGLKFAYDLETEDKNSDSTETTNKTSLSELSNLMNQLKNL